MKYVVVYVSDLQPDQVITNPIDFDTANQFAAEMTAEVILEGAKLNEESFVVQPYVES